MTDISTLVKNNGVQFVAYHDGNLFYAIDDDLDPEGLKSYSFPVSVTEAKDQILRRYDKAERYESYIRAAHKTGRLILAKPGVARPNQHEELS